LFQSIALVALLFLMGLAVGYLSGLVGIGGAVLLAPLVVLVPPALGYPAVPGAAVSAIGMAQAWASAAAGAPVYWRRQDVDYDLVLWMGAAALLGGLGGGILAASVSDNIFIVLFAVLAGLGALALVVPGLPTTDHGAPRKGWRALVGACSLVITFFGGLVGSSGSFLLTPIVTRGFKMAFRPAVGSVLTVVLITATASLVGRALTGTVPWIMAAAVAVAGAQGSSWGARHAGRVPVAALRWLLAVLVAGASLLLWHKVWTGT
jgi:uncharacterized membrane protein YfcA